MKLLTNWYSFLFLLGVYLWMPNSFVAKISCNRRAEPQRHTDLSWGYALKTPATLDKKEHKKVALGRKLFFFLVSCSSCHNPALIFQMVAHSPSAWAPQQKQPKYRKQPLQQLVLLTGGPIHSLFKHLVRLRGKRTRQ